MYKNLFISIGFLCLLLSACATKPAPQVSTALPVAPKSADAADETFNQSTLSVPSVEVSGMTESSLANGRTKGVGAEAAEGMALETVYFDFDSFLLNETARESLTKTAKVFIQNRELKAIVAGHCDDRGAEMYNIALGERRATSVKGYLTALGVEPDRLEVVSYGEERPAVSDFDEQSRALNRRVEFM